MPWTRPSLVAAVAALSACGGSDPLVRPQPEPSLAPPPTTAAAPAPTPEPTPGPSTNRAPRVTLTGGGVCHPSVGSPCGVEFQVEARDPDGDRMTFQWQGCTSGSGFTERCTIDRPGEHTATVVVTDAQGAKVRASATATGSNQLPVVHIGPSRPPDPAPSNHSYTIVGDEPYDPDDYSPYSNQACPHARVTASGPCRAAIGLCGGAGDAFDIDVTTLAGPGTCTLEATVTDPWGAVGRDRFAFRVLAP
jgi:hypothetical protein